MCLSLYGREGGGSVPLGSSVPLGICVSVLSLTFYLPVPVEGLGEPSFQWVCPSGQSVTTFESSWSLSRVCLCPDMERKGVLFVSLRTCMSVSSEGLFVSL